MSNYTLIDFILAGIVAAWIGLLLYWSISALFVDYEQLKENQRSKGD
jgi:hypothetical protein